MLFLGGSNDEPRTGMCGESLALGFWELGAFSVGWPPSVAQRCLPSRWEHSRRGWRPSKNESDWRLRSSVLAMPVQRKPFGSCCSPAWRKLPEAGRAPESSGSGWNLRVRAVTLRARVSVSVRSGRAALTQLVSFGEYQRALCSRSPSNTCHGA